MLAGDRTAFVDTQPENVGTKLLGFFQVARLVGIIQDQRMQVAVTGMENVGAAQAIVLRQLGDPAQHFG